MSNLIPFKASELELQSITETGRAVKRRIASCEAVRTIVDRMRQDDEPEAARRAILQGMYDGNPPMDPKALEEVGLADIINVNFLEMRANLDARAAGTYELFFEVPTLVEIKGDIEDPRIPSSDFPGVIAEEFSNLLLDWPGFLVNLDQVNRQSDLTGLGAAVFLDEWDWRPRSFRRNKFYFPTTANLDIDQLEYFALMDSRKVSELLDAVDDEEEATTAGWNVKVVREALIKSLSSGSTGNAQQYAFSSWEDVQQRIRNNDPYIQSAQQRDIPLIHFLVREVDSGRVSHYIISESGDVTEFLFVGEDRYEGMRQVLWWLPFNYGDGYLRSVRGVASLMAPYDDLSNRFLSRVFDAGFMVSSLLVQPKTAQDVSRMQLVRVGPMTMVDPNLTIQQSSFAPQIAPLVQLRDLAASIMKNNTGTYRQHPELMQEGGGTAKTAYQVAQEVAKEARYEKADVAHRYNHLDHLYREIFRRVCRREYIYGAATYPGQAEARRFIDRCVRRGVPEVLLFEEGYWKLSATRAIGLGSLGVRLDITNQLLEAREMFDELGKVNALRDWLAARVGQQNVDRYRTSGPRDAIPINETSIAALETGAMFRGETVPVGVDQLHTLHWGQHTQIVDQVVATVAQAQQQMALAQLDAGRLVQILSVTMPHLEQHLAAISRDPAQQAFVEEGVAYLKQTLQILAILKGLAGAQNQVAAQEAEASAPPEQVGNTGMTEEGLLKMIELQNAGKKIDSLNQQRMIKMTAQLQQNREAHAARLQLEAQSASAKLALEAKKADADVEIKRAKAGIGTGGEQA